MMTEKRIGAYVGIDPTASSLHVGHMLPLMSLFWMYVHGYATISLIGGATAKIGDPTDRLITRENTKEKVQEQNTSNMELQLERLWVSVERYARKYGFERNSAWQRASLNNSKWMSTLTIMEVLQVLGPGMRLGSMLARDTYVPLKMLSVCLNSDANSVKNKMKKGDGMSYAEFSYPILQAWDWWHMYMACGIQMQIGGSDQYGNITAGIDAVKYISANCPLPNLRETVATQGPPFGFTVPLLTTSSGQKFGKSAGNAIWLDVNQTSSFELYKFFLGTSDADVGRYLRLFTFMPIEQIDNLVEEHTKSASLRIAQHALARDFVELVHGEEEARYAESQHRLLFAGKTMSTEEYAAAQAAATMPRPPAIEQQDFELPEDEIGVKRKLKPHLKLPRAVIDYANIGKILLACGLAKSASEGHRLVSSQAIYVGSLSGGTDHASPIPDGPLDFTLVKAWAKSDMKKYMIANQLLIFRRGKHNIRIIEVLPDHEYCELGLTYPGIRKMPDEREGLEPSTEEAIAILREQNPDTKAL
jgi:tyrosyl-tRNA synthetase